MAVLGRLLVSSAERLDLPDLLSLDSYAAGDWKYFLKGLVGDTKPYILKGFDVIDPTNAIGTQSCSIRVADSITFYPGSNSGSFFHGLAENHPQAAPLVPELRKNAVNYVYLTFSTFNTSVDTRAFWDPDKDGGVGGEFTQDINTESVLKVDVNVSTGSFPANTVPVAKITVGPVVITAIEDARDLMFRLGSGGINPNPFNTYAWRSQPGSQYARQEPPTQMLAGGVNPFQGADKNILTLKEWMDAVMSKLRELGGTTYWYDDTSSFSIITNFYDAIATAFKSKGKWIHDLTTPGLLTWTEDIQIKMTSDPRTYIIRQGSAQLADEQVMYLAMQRNLPFNTTDESVSWINGQVYVNTIGGAVGLFANLSKGDYIKKANDTIDKWVRVEEFYDAVNLGGSTTTAAGARSVRLGSPYLGGTGAEKGRYDKGVYLANEVIVSDRDQAAISNIGGNFHWLALRSDTIENVSNIVTTNLTVAIDEHDGSTARVTSTAHGLVDGDRVTISGTTNFNGTFQVEVESANIFYINVPGGPFADESGVGHYATVTTSARLTPYGFQEESANHGFNSDDTIQIGDTTNYDGSYKINVRSATSFTIAVPAAAATETTGTATLAKIIVRTEGAVAQIIQGQVIDIGGSIADNIRQYVGMDSLSQTAPNYTIPPSYNTLDGMQNYNGVVNENLTVRVAKLTAMMADKAQDKMIRALPSSGITSINNTQNGAAQELTFSPNGASLTFITPGSNGQAFVALPGTAPGISLLQNQTAYVQIDRNAPSSPAIIVANTEDVPVDENTYLIAVRMNTPDIYIWEGSIIATGGTPGPGQLPIITQQNQMLKLVEGGTWSWDLATETLSWDADAVVQIPGLANSVNTIPAGSIVLNAGEVATIDINRVGPGAALTPVAVTNASITTTTNLFIMARRETTDVIVGLHSMRLVDGESKKIYAATSDQTLTFIGATGGADAAPNYASNNYITDGDSLVQAISDLDAATGGIAGSIRWKEPVADVAALPLVGNLDGDVRLTLDTRTAYSWIDSLSLWRPISGGSNSPKILDGGTWSNVISGGSASISFTADAYVERPGLANTDNTISVSNSPIVLPTVNHVAYISQINFTTGGPALTIGVDLPANLQPNNIIIARRDATSVVVGSSSMRLLSGESKRLYTGVSDQLLSARGDLNNADRTGQGRLLARTASATIDVSPINKIGQDGTAWAKTLEGLSARFDGAVINFTTGVITKADGVTALGTNFTPDYTAANQYRWYSVTAIPLATNSVNEFEMNLLIIPATTTAATAGLALKAPYGDGIRLGQVLVQANGPGTGPQNILQSALLQAVDAGSGGSGDTFEIYERIKEEFQDSIFEFVTPSVFAMVKATLTDGVNTTGSYDVVSKGYLLNSSQKFTSIQMLDPDYLSAGRDVNQIQVMAFWKPGAVDTAAVYRASRNNKNNWQTINMSRVGNTDAFSGVLNFVEDTPYQNTVANPSGGTVTARELNATTQQALAQPITVASTWVLNQLTGLTFTKTGSPTGYVYAEIAADNAGVPGTVFATSEFKDISTLATGSLDFAAGTVIPAGNYWISLRTSDTYKAAFSAGVNSISFSTRTGSALAAIQAYNGTTYSAIASNSLIFTALTGRELILNLDVTASANGRVLMGFAILYGTTATMVVGDKKIETFTFSGDTNVTTFTINRFKPSADLLKVYDVNSGKVYTYGAFSISGNTVIFDNGQFLSPGETIKLTFEQTNGGNYDNSDNNANLLAENRLGSRDATQDRSVAGEGILLRSTNGDLCEVWLEWNGTSHDLKINKVN